MPSPRRLRQRMSARSPPRSQVHSNLATDTLHPSRTHSYWPDGLVCQDASDSALIQWGIEAAKRWTEISRHPQYCSADTHGPAAIGRGRASGPPPRFRDQLDRPIRIRAVAESPVMRGAQVDRRGRLPAFPAPEALHGLHHRHVAALLHEELGGRYRASPADRASRLDEAFRPIRQVVREAELGRVHWRLFASGGVSLQDDVVGSLHSAHDLRGKMCRSRPVGRGTCPANDQPEVAQRVDHNPREKCA
jgi:hypothetical protein